MSERGNSRQVMPGDSDIHTIRLPYKGDRTYLHGTDIIPSLLALSGPVTDLSVQIYKLTSHTLEARFIDQQALKRLRKTGELCVLMTYRDEQGDPMTIAVTEDLSEEVTSSRPYDEAAVAQGWTLSGSAITQETPSQGTFFERVVALNKIVLNETQGKSNWLFGSIELSHVPSDPGPLSLELTGTIGGKAYKSAIYSGDDLIGSIVFARRAA